MSYLFPLVNLETYDRYCFYDSYFTPEECDRIISCAQQFPLSDAEIGDSQVIHDVRKSKVRWFSVNDNNRWFFDRMYSVILGANTRYQYQLTGFLESMQFTEYEAPGSHYEWHQDSGNKDYSIRKLSMVVHLSDPSEFEGGELEIFKMNPIPKNRGTVIVFPSYEQHRVTPVTSGIRRSMVAWVSGPPYR